MLLIHKYQFRNKILQVAINIYSEIFVYIGSSATLSLLHHYKHQATYINFLLSHKILFKLLNIVQNNCFLNISKHFPALPS